MFSGHNVSSISDSNDYDFEKQENAAKWKGVFITSLRKVRMEKDSVFRTTFVSNSFDYVTGPGAGASLAVRPRRCPPVRGESLPAPPGHTLRQTTAPHDPSESLHLGESPFVGYSNSNLSFSPSRTLRSASARPFPRRSTSGR